MAYSQSVLRAARARLAQAKSARDAENAAHLAEAYARYPRLAEIDRELSSTVAKAVAASLRTGEDPTQTIEALRQQNLDLQRERAWLVSGLEEGFLDDSPICPVCGGTGYVGDRMCECLRELCRQEQKRELTSLLAAGNARFEQFRLDVYPNDYLEEYGCSARRMMQLLFNRCKSYAAGFAPGAQSMLFTGGPGLGKTFLSACIARSVADGGHSVVYETVIRMLEDFEAAKFGNYSEESRGQTEKYLSCDLLIVDDLGSEMTTQFSMSALYHVINTRLMEGRSTIISTNLTPDALTARYSQAICSRLLGSYRLMQFLGNDLRSAK